MKLTLVIASVVAIIGIVWAADVVVTKGCIPCGTKPSGDSSGPQIEEIVKASR